MSANNSMKRTPKNGTGVTEKSYILKNKKAETVCKHYLYFQF